jgi:hypothetical protein
MILQIASSASRISNFIFTTQLSRSVANAMRLGQGASKSPHLQGKRIFTLNETPSHSPHVGPDGTGSSIRMSWHAAVWLNVSQGSFADAHQHRWTDGPTGGVSERNCRPAWMLMEKSSHNPAPRTVWYHYKCAHMHGAVTYSSRRRIFWFMHRERLLIKLPRKCELH